MEVAPFTYRKPRSRKKGSMPRLSKEGEGVWTTGEHERFLEAIEIYPRGPWKLVAGCIGTRSTRQTMTHAQKYRQKLERRRRGLRSARSKQTEALTGFRAGSKTLGFEEEWVTVDGKVVGDTWKGLAECQLVEPIPLKAANIVMQPETTEPSWVDECLDFFVDNFS